MVGINDGSIHFIVSQVRAVCGDSRSVSLLASSKMYCDWPELGRCCFCLPLRKGIIIYAYVNIIFCAFMIGLLSYTIHHNDTPTLLIYSRILNFPAELCITIYCVEVVFSVALIYGAHMKSVLYVKAYYYFALVSTVALVVLEILFMTGETFYFGMIMEMLIFIFAGLCMQIYLVTIVRSLIKKLEIDGSHVYDNPLNQIVTGELKVETNGVYNNLTTPADVKN